MNQNIYQLSLKNLVPNAFIELNNRSETKITEISLETIENYGYEVGKMLKKYQKRVLFLLSRIHTTYFFEQFDDYFIEKSDEVNHQTTIVLKDGIEIEELEEKFNTNESIGLLQVFMDDSVVKNGLLNHIEDQNSSIQKRLRR